MWVFHLCGHFCPFVCWVGYQQFFQIWFCSMAAYNSLLCSNTIGNLFIHKSRRVSDSFLMDFVVSNKPFFPLWERLHYWNSFFKSEAIALFREILLRAGRSSFSLSVSVTILFAKISKFFLPQIDSNLSWITWLLRYLLKTSVQSTWQARGEQNR